MSCSKEPTVALASVLGIVEIHILFEVSSLCELLIEIIMNMEINTFFLAARALGVRRRYVLNRRPLLARC